MKKKIAVIDDEEDILSLVALHLERADFSPVLFKKGKDFLRFLKVEKPLLVILDLMLTDMDGIEICKNMRNDKSLKDIPIIMLTARASEGDKILGLELGADDYITKPFSPRELIARVKAVLRRNEKLEKPEDIIDVDGVIRIDVEKHLVYANGRKVDLTNTEFNILKILCENRGRVFSREKILDKMWGNEKVVTDRTIDVHIKKLRDKLGNAAKMIKNIRGVGYKIEE